MNRTDKAAIGVDNAIYLIAAATNWKNVHWLVEILSRHNGAFLEPLNTIVL